MRIRILCIFVFFTLFSSPVFAERVLKVGDKYTVSSSFKEVLVANLHGIDYKGTHYPFGMLCAPKRGSIVEVIAVDTDGSSFMSGEI